MSNLVPSTSIPSRRLWISTRNRRVHRRSPCNARRFSDERVPCCNRAVVYTSNSDGVMGRTTADRVFRFDVRLPKTMDRFGSTFHTTSASKTTHRRGASRVRSVTYFGETDTTRRHSSRRQDAGSSWSSHRPAKLHSWVLWKWCIDVHHVVVVNRLFMMQKAPSCDGKRLDHTHASV